MPAKKTKPAKKTAAKPAKKSVAKAPVKKVVTKKAVAPKKTATSPRASRFEPDTYEKDMLHAIRGSGKNGILRLDLEVAAGLMALLPVDVTKRFRRLKRAGLVYTKGDTKAARWFAA